MKILSDCDLPLVIIGAGGHAKVLLSLAQALGLTIHGVCAPELREQGASKWRGYKVLGGDEALEMLDPSAVGLVNGIGQLVGSVGRRKAYERFAAKGFRFPALIHPAAWVDPSVTLYDGSQIMAGAIIQADTVIGANSIVNTRASIDHDCRIGSHVHIAPGATLCGNVLVGERAFIACNAAVIQGINVGDDAVVGAGAVLVRDLAAHNIMFGSRATSRFVPNK
ncbi:acetyltransferase [Pseudomonas sp. MDT2-39-1]